MKQKVMPFVRYRPYPAVAFPERTWPGTRISRAPVWCSIDLRDGNQALPRPMNVAEKLELFQVLVEIGFKEIEVGFPSASQVEFDFVRLLIEGGYIPDDVTVQVLTQAREHLIRRTFESLDGVSRAIVHVYNSTSTTQRKVVFGKSRAAVTRIATDAACLMRQLREDFPAGTIRFEYTPESFTGTEPEYAVDICRAVMEVWRPTPQEKVILNLPATVEMCTPNVYADRIEWFATHIGNRDSLVLSVHTHNDRGTAVAAAELAVMAGAERVEGALFGNGERTGNMDIVTMALNLFSQGVDPGLDFSDLPRIRQIYSRCTRMSVHDRHPYAGDLVYTAFSGSHQDAIHKGMNAGRQQSGVQWDVPYLPIDPRDVGRDYESIIRINSQSGKGGVAYILEYDWGFRIPKKMQPELAVIIQRKTEELGRELSSREVYDCFRQEYFPTAERYRLERCAVRTEPDGATGTSVQAVVQYGARDVSVCGTGNGPVDAFVRGMRSMFGVVLEVAEYQEHAVGSGSDAEAVAYTGMRGGDGTVVFGVGRDGNISVASIKAVLCAINRMQGFPNQ